MEFGILIFLFFLIAIAGAAVFIRWKALNKRLAEEEQRFRLTSDEFDQYKKQSDHLRQYEIIDDAKLEAQNIIQRAEVILQNSELDYQSKIAEGQGESDEKLKQARIQAKSIRQKAEVALEEAHNIASKIEQEARAKAEQIAGDALIAKNNADQYEATVKAMKNIIKGYGDEYLIPNESVLDGLAAEYDHKEAGQSLKTIRSQIKSMIKNSEAADCDYVEARRKTTAIDFVLDAYNGKVDSIMSKVKHDNFGKLKQQLEDAYRLVNHNGQPFRDARIMERYHQVMLQQLKMAVTVQELKRIDQEEQRRIKDEMREEERARREFDKALKAAEKEEKILQKALQDAEARLATAAEEERSKFEQQLRELNEKLVEAEARGQRALSMAQQTKQGHVYVISNVGSFGEDVFKIGLTRRLEPHDRVKELGDASVPFSFDVHAMIHSEDAPRLEKDLHVLFKDNQVNKVNPRKEFFRVPLAEIRELVDEKGLETHWTMKAEALEYRESVQMAKTMSPGVPLKENAYA